MKVFAGIMNVLCIILSLFVGLAMLIMLIVTPLVCSTLDVINPDKLTKIVTDIITSEGPTAGYGPYSSSSTSDALGSIASGDIGAELKDYILGEYGEYVTEETLNDILNSEVVQEVIGAYAEDVTNALTGSDAEAKFTTETIKQIVDEHADEIIDILQEVSPELADTDRAEIKNKILSAVDTNVDQIVEVLPKPQEVKDAIVEEMPELEIGLEILAHRDEIKTILWGAVAVLALLMFILRLFRISGFLWIAVYLFIGAAFNGVFCITLKSVPALVMGSPSISTIIEAMLNPLFSSMLTYTLILLGVGILCLVAHIFIQKARKAHREKKLPIPAGTVLYTTCIDEDTFVGSSIAEEAAPEEMSVPDEEPAAEEPTAAE